MSLTYSWGMSPASASIVAKGNSTFTANDQVVLNIGPVTFHGKVVADPKDVSDSEGEKYQFSVVDNRELLKEDIVKCRFNKVVIKEDNPATPGIDRWKRYEHILPDDWEPQTRTFTDSPMAAEEILDYLFNAPTVSNSWSRSYHEDQQKPVHEIDCNHGKSLANAVSEVTEAQGLVMTLAGEDELIWGRKGEDEVPAPGASNCYDISSGQSLNTNATRVTIVGDANRYQELSIALEQDWATAWEAFWIEPNWLAAVEAAFGPYEEDDAGRAELAAKARAVTVREYAAAASDPNFEDDRKLGEVCRNDLPAWTYLTRVVWHAYRVPLSYTINGITLPNLRLVDDILITVEGNLDTGEITVKSPDKLYPPGAGFIMAQGQQLGIIDPRTQRTITEEQLAAAREKWAPCNDFSLDKENNSILFEDAVFLPGEDAAGLFVFPNHGIEDMEETDPLYNIVVPNAAATASPAAVRASLCFEAELFSREYGSGRRASAEYVSGLNFHSLLDEGANIREITYQDGKGAEEKAEEYSDSLIVNQVTYLFGGFSRKGAAGTALNSSIDRVTVSYGTGGISERIEYTKERGPSHFTPEKELERREKEKDRYPGERKLDEEVKQLQAIAAISRSAGGSRKPYAHAAAVLATPVGALHSSPVLVNLAGTELAGNLIWRNDAGEVSTAAGAKIFAGVVIADGSTGRCALATQGTVPVRVKGPFQGGDAVGANEDGVVLVDGSRTIGVVQGKYDGEEDVLVPVRLGAGGAAATDLDFPFRLIDASTSTGEGAGPKLMVSLNSWLSASEDLADKVAITGLGGAFSIAVDQFICLEVEWDATTGVRTSVSIKQYDIADSEFASPSDYIVSYNSGEESKRQTKVRRFIGFTRANDAEDFYPVDRMTITGGEGEDATSMQVVQCLHTHLLLCLDCWKGGPDRVVLLKDFSHVPFITPTPP